VLEFIECTFVDVNLLVAGISPCFDAVDSAARL